MLKERWFFVLCSCFLFLVSVLFLHKVRIVKRGAGLLTIY